MGNTIGNRIRARREELGMTQEQLAKKLGYKNRSSVNKVENSRELQNKKVKMFADALGVSCSYLMGWEDINGNSINYVPKYEPDIQELIEMYSKLTTEQKHQVLALLRSFVN